MTMDFWEINTPAVLCSLCKNFNLDTTTCDHEESTRFTFSKLNGAEFEAKYDCTYFVPKDKKKGYDSITEYELSL